MRLNMAAKMFCAHLLAFVVTHALCPLLEGQQPSHCSQILFCQLNQEAVASDPLGIHKYTEDLVALIVPNPGGEASVRQLTNQLADRLAKTEQAARTSGGKLVPEVAVVKAFNDLMQQIGAPPSLRASEPLVHAFREHASSIKAFPVLFTVDRNGANCNPGEATFLLYLLIMDNGVLHERNLDSAQALMQMDSHEIKGYGVARMEGLGLNAKRPDSSASGLLSSYLSHHSRNATITLFNHVAGILGF